MTQVTRRRLSLFAFGSNSSNLSKDKEDDEKSTNQISRQNTVGSKLSVSTSPNLRGVGGPHSPLDTTSAPLPTDDLNIFERNVQEGLPFDPPKKHKSKSGRSSSLSLSTQFKNEDCIPAALDATTSLLNDNNTNLDDVEMVFSSRRNSSVLGLNMALGRSFTPSRKNSVYSMSQLHGPPQTSPIPMAQIQPASHPISPTSPPKLTSSKSAISFYSYADMINNEELGRKPSFKQAYSQGIVPTLRKNSIASSLKSFSNSSTPKESAASSRNKFNSNLNKFLISPESSDAEDEFKKIPQEIEEEPFVSTTVSDCLRQTTNEINSS